MQNKNFKKLVAFALAATMTAGSAVTVFADVGNVTGKGESTGHLNTNYVRYTVPKDSTLETRLNYTADPERIIDKAGKLTGGEEVTKNDEGVYFANTDLGTTATLGKGSYMSKADGPKGYKVSGTGLAENGTYTYKLQAVAVEGTVTSTIAADADSNYNVTVSDLSVNTTYTYKDGKWYATGDDEETSVTITVKTSDNTADGTLANDDKVKVSGAKAAIEEDGWYSGTGEKVEFNVVDESDATVTPAAGDEIIVNEATAGTAGSGVTYSATSDPIVVTVKNYVEAEVSMKAEVVENENNLPLAATQTDFDNATVAMLKLQLNVGDKSGFISDNGVTVKKEVAAQESNFDVDVDTTAKKYSVKPKSDEDMETANKKWTTVEITVTGAATSGKEITDDAVAPRISYTWDVKAKEEETDDSGSTTPTTVDPEEIASIISGDKTLYVRLVTGQNAVAEKLTSVKVDGTATTSFSVAQSGAIIINNLTAGAHTITIVYDETTYEGTGTAN